MNAPGCQPAELSVQERELLEELDSCLHTTATLWRQLGGRGSMRTLTRQLQRLAALGLVQAARLYPACGTRSPYYWVLTAAGAAALRVPWPGRPDLSEVHKHLRLVAPPTVPLHPGQRALLGLLAMYHQLTTAQLATARHCTRPAVRGQLTRLTARGYIVGTALSRDVPTGSTEYYWVLTAAGAAAIGVAYQPYLARRPSVPTLAYRTLQIALAGQVQAAGWRLYPPGRRAWPGNPDVLALLTRAVLAREGQELARLLRTGTPLDGELRARLARYHQGDTGGLVPARVGDYMAVLPGRAEQVVVLILQPEGTGLNFWRRPPHRAGGQPRDVTNESRMERWWRLAPVLPAFGVFPTLALREAMAPALAETAIRLILVGEVAAQLRALRG